MYKVIVSEAAAADILYLKSYIKWTYDANAAESIVNDIYEMISSLDYSPARFQVFKTNDKESIRRVMVRKHNIFYSVNDLDKTVTILRILYAGIDTKQITIE